jgi:hypothetical protein
MDSAAKASAGKQRFHGWIPGRTHIESIGSTAAMIIDVRRGDVE